MPKSMGQIIKELRKEHDYTQEELAELLNVSGQAVSKWENETSMPDISQIVPLAKVFGVSTDVLFDTCGSDDDEVENIIKEAERQISADGGCIKKAIYSAYLTVQEGLKRYPTSMALLMYSLSMGVALVYPENDCYDAAHAKEIYEASIRQANIVISHGKNTNDILHAHMFMVLLHSVNGNMSSAREHADQFPIRSDMTYYNMNAYVSHAEGKYANESRHRQNECLYLLEAMLDNMAAHGRALLLAGKYQEALTAFNSAFDLIKLFFKDEEHLPPMHVRECGDLYALIAETYVKINDTGRAISQLEKMVDYELDERSGFTPDMMARSPLLPDDKDFYNYRSKTRKEHAEALSGVLNSNAFSSLKDMKEYKELINRVDYEMNA